MEQPRGAELAAEAWRPTGSPPEKVHAVAGADGRPVWTGPLDRLRFTRLEFLNRHAYLSRDWVFVHNPRAAGHSVSQCLYGRPLGHLPALRIQHAIGREAFRSRFVFGIVRCPVDRLVSAFRFSQAAGTPLVRQDWYRRPPRWALGEFSRFVQEWLIHKDVATLDFVFRPQSYWFTDAQGRPMVDRLFDISDAGAVLRLMQHRKSVGGPIGAWMNEAQAPAVDTERLPPATIDAILRFYQEDVALFGQVFTSRFTAGFDARRASRAPVRLPAARVAAG